MRFLFKYINFFVIVVVLLGGIIPTIAQEKCEIRYWSKSATLDLDDIKLIAFNDRLRLEFYQQALMLNVQFFSPIKRDLQVSSLLSIDKKISYYSDDVQDIFWLFTLAEYSDIKEFFSSRNSDFAPYILRALKRQNLTEMADRFMLAMAVFDNRYNAFNELEQSIKKFPIPVTAQELNNIQLYIIIVDAFPNNWGAIPKILQQKKLERAHYGDNITFDRLYQREYEIFYKQNPKILAAQNLLDGFPKQDQIYGAIFTRICQNPSLKEWYYTKYKGVAAEQQLSDIALTLVFEKKSCLVDI